LAGHVKVLPMSIIQAAIDGDGTALATIINHYKGYIEYLSVRPLKDEYGNEYLCVDEDMQHRLEAKLIFSIVTGFKVLSA
jgi:hypothetical protein